MKLEQAFNEYAAGHRNPWNLATHTVGIPLILISLGALLMGEWTLFATCFIVGWAFQFLGHFIEGNKPKFFENPLFLIVGPLYFALKPFYKRTQ